MADADYNCSLWAFRYIYLVTQHNEAVHQMTLLKDKPILLTGLFYIMTMVLHLTLQLPILPPTYEQYPQQTYHPTQSVSESVVAQEVPATLYGVPPLIEHLCRSPDHIAPFASQMPRL